MNLALALLAASSVALLLLTIWHYERELTRARRDVAEAEDFADECTLLLNLDAFQAAMDRHPAGKGRGHLSLVVSE